MTLIGRERERERAFILEGNRTPVAKATDITDCAAKSVLFAVAFHARKCFGAATPSELYDCIKHRGHITMILNLLIEKVAYSRHGPTSA